MEAGEKGGSIVSDSFVIAKATQPASGRTAPAPDWHTPFSLLGTRA